MIEYPAKDVLPPKNLLLSNLIHIFVNPEPKKYKLTKSFQFLSLKSSEGLLLSLFIPLLGPNGRTNANSQLPHILASLLISGILDTEKPFVISIPTVVGLILGWESRITNGSLDVSNNLHGLLLLIGDLNLLSENSLDREEVSYECG